MALLPSGSLKFLVQIFRAMPENEFFQSHAFWYIFLHNLRGAAICLGLSIFLGLGPFLILLVTGISLGMLSVFMQVLNKDLAFVISLLPHSIFEIPALFLSTAIGFRLAAAPFKKILSPQTRSLKREFINAVKAFIFIILPLLLLAALIEVFVSAQITKLFLK